MTPRSWLRRTVQTAVLLVTATVLAVAWTAVQVWSTARDDDRPRSDVVLVLGTSQYDGRPSPIFQARLKHAAVLYRADVAPRILTVGGKLPGDRFTEAEAGARYLGTQGVASEDVVTVAEGDDTLSSLRAVARVMKQRGWRSAVLVTDPWHSLRSREIAEDLGLDAATSPARSGPAVASRRTEARYIVRETAALLAYQITHLG